MIEIYGTLGPSCSRREILEQMFREGMTGIRLNLSHTSLEKSAELIGIYQKAALSCGKKADLLIDMQGPELRIGHAEEKDLKCGQTVILAADGDIPVPSFILDEIRKNDHILLDDGKIELQIQETGRQKCSASVIRGGRLKPGKSIKIRERSISRPVLTNEDILNLASAHEYGVTAVMQPFVRCADDLRKVRSIMNESGAGDLRLFAKIEDMEGAGNIEEIIQEADMVVIARGDLGNDVPLWHLPYVQKTIETACLNASCPFMVVTQMLASMELNPSPTRAEVSDIFNAAADGASAVMVTNETAAGNYPAEVIRYLSKTAAEGEIFRNSHQEER